MKLLYFINSITNSGGMERIVIDKINYLVNLDDYEVALSYFGSKEDHPFFKIDNRVVLLPLGEQNIGCSIRMKLWSFFHLPNRVECAIKEFEPDAIVNANTILVSWLLPFICRQIPKIVELHFSYIGMKMISEEQFGHNWLKRKFNYYLRKWGYPLYDRCVLLTEEDKRDWGFNNAIVIPNFSNLCFSVSSGKSSQKIAINVGRLSRPKNQELLIDAWKIVHNEFPEWKLNIWGDGELKNDLENRINLLELNSVVELKGVSHKIEEVYQNASFFILSSLYEGQPLVMIEALKAGLPCVCTAVNGVRETIKNDYNGYIIDEMRPEALAKGIIKMIRSNCKMELSQNAHKSAEAFEKDRIMQQWIMLFENLVYGKDRKDI